MSHGKPGSHINNAADARRLRRRRAVLRRVLHVCEYSARVILLLALLSLLLAIIASLHEVSAWHYLPGIALFCAVTLGIGMTLLLLARVTAIGAGWLGVLFALLLLNFGLACLLLGRLLHFPPDGALLASLSAVLPGVGKYLLIISLMHLVAANVYMVLHGRQLRADVLQHGIENLAGKLEARQTSFFSHCWEMSACSEPIRARCPNFKEKISCWKRHCGCLCDRKLATFLLRAKHPLSGVVNEEATILDLTDVPEIATFAERLRAEPYRPWRVQRRRCHNCAIYLEHQYLKYRRLNWIFLPITVLLTFVFAAPYHQGYLQLARSLDRLSDYLLSKGLMPSGFYGNAGVLLDSPYEYLLFAALVLLLMSYIIEFTDRCLLEWKL